LLLFLKKSGMKKQSGENSKATKKDATPTEKRIFNKEKKKQFAKDKAEFDYESDEDTTGRSESFKSNKINGPKRGNG
jgi:hypothetical protein